MKNLFKPGDIKTFMKKVSAADTAAFQAGEVHPVYSSFALARDAEWTCRQFVLDMKENDEEGIGTLISVNHLSPALVNDEVSIMATVEHITGNEIMCNYEAKVGNRLIARGQQGQKIIKKTKLNRLFEDLKNG